MIIEYSYIDENGDIILKQIEQELVGNELKVVNEKLVKMRKTNVKLNQRLHKCQLENAKKES